MAAKGAWLYDMAKQAFDESSTSLTKTVYQPVYNKTATPLAIMKLGGLTDKQLGSYTEEVYDGEKWVERTVPNKVVIAGRDINSGRFYIVTTESQKKAEKTGIANDEFIEMPNPQAFIDSCVTGATDDDDLEWATPDMYLAHHFANLIINDHALDIAELMTY